MKNFFSRFVAVIAVLGGGAVATAGTIQDWINAGSISDGNLQYTYISTTLDPLDDINFFSDGPEDDYLTVTAKDGTQITAATLVYEVNVLDPHYMIKSVDVDVVVLKALGGKVEKEFNDGTTLDTTANGGFDVKDLVGGLASYLKVSVTITPGPSVVTSFGDSYHLVPVPEPSTFALLGLGASGLVFCAARRRKTA